MAKSRTGPPVYHEPTPKQEMGYALGRAVEKAVLNHPQTQKLKKVIETEMKRAAKFTPKKK